MRWTPKDDATFIAMVKDGASHKALARKFDRTIHAIEVRVRKMRHLGKLAPDDGQTKNGHQHWTPARDARLMELIAKGMRVQDVAELVGRSHASVAKRIKELREKGVMPYRERPQAWSAEEEQLARRLQREGFNGVEIATRLCRPASSVSYKLTALAERERGTSMHATRHGAVSPAALAERERRLSLNWNRPTVQLGDPLPGYSALDRMRSGG